MKLTKMCKISDWSQELIAICGRVKCAANKNCVTFILSIQFLQGGIDISSTFSIQIHPRVTLAPCPSKSFFPEVLFNIERQENKTFLSV